jgi:hypothetical protein
MQEQSSLWGLWGIGGIKVMSRREEPSLKRLNTIAMLSTVRGSILKQGKRARTKRTIRGKQSNSHPVVISHPAQAMQCNSRQNKETGKGTRNVKMLRWILSPTRL